MRFVVHAALSVAFGTVILATAYGIQHLTIGHATGIVIGALLYAALITYCWR